MRHRPPRTPAPPPRSSRTAAALRTQASAGWCDGAPRRMLLGLLLALLVWVVAAGPAQAHPSTFGDVPASHPAHDAVEYLAAAKVVSGFEPGVFGPERNLTRGQAAKILVGQREVAPVPGPSRFEDVDATYASYVEAAASRGWIAGYPDGTFRPYDHLQRQHLAVIMVRSLGWEGEALSLSTSQVDSALAAVPDAGTITTNARPHVALALSRGLVLGDTQGRFNPRATATRAQFSLVAYRAELRGLAVVEGIRFSASHPDRTRLVVDLSNPPGRVTTSPAAGSLQIGVTGAVAPGGGSSTTVASAEVASLRSSQASYRPPSLRLTVDLGRYSRYEITTLAPSDGKGHRLVIDVFRRAEGPSGDGPPLVVLDAGHGGSDPGAIGVTGLKEKDVNLAITLALDQLLRQAGLRTILTRSGDTYPTLEDRARIANEARANIFVSVHSNAAGGPEAQGTETFYQGTPEDYSLEGCRLAELIQDELITALGSVDRGARTHWKSLYVLNHTNMPAALVEVGFLTNAEEEARLKDPAYQARAARAIAEGVLAYLDWSYTFPD